MDVQVPEQFRDIIAQTRELARGELLAAENEVDRNPDPEQAYTSETYRAAVKQIYGLGLHKLSIAPELGGLGAPPGVRYRMLEELSYGAPGLACKLLVAPTGAACVQLLALQGRDAPFRDYLEAYVADDQGIHSGAWAVTEPEVGSDIFAFGRPDTRLTAVATKTSSGWRLDGTKSGFVSNGWLADMILLMVNVDGSDGMEGSGSFVVPGDLPGIRRSAPLDKVGLRALNQSEIIFEGAELSDDHLIVPAGPQYRPLFENIVTGGNTAVGIIALGVAQSAYDRALAYAKERRQSGARLIDLQLVAQKVFDAYRSIEASRLMLYRSAELIAEQRGDMAFSFAARVQACETCERVTAAMSQVLGGYGIRRDHHVEKAYRDARPLQIMDGTIERVTISAAERL